MNCPCCGKQMSRSPYDPDFCWDCGLYPADPASECDTHQTSSPGAGTPPSPGTGPTTNRPEGH